MSCICLARLIALSNFLWSFAGIPVTLRGIILPFSVTKRFRNSTFRKSIACALISILFLLVIRRGLRRGDCFLFDLPMIATTKF